MATKNVSTQKWPQKNVNSKNGNNKMSNQKMVTKKCQPKKWSQING